MKKPLRPMQDEFRDPRLAELDRQIKAEKEAPKPTRRRQSKEFDRIFDKFCKAVDPIAREHYIDPVGILEAKPDANEIVRAHRRLQKLKSRLRQARSHDNGRAFSFLLQGWLHIEAVSWPKGVFCFDMSARRGRPRSQKAEEARAEYKAYEMGYGKTAKKVLGTTDKRAISRTRSAVRTGPPSEIWKSS